MKLIKNKLSENSKSFLKIFLEKYPKLENCCSMEENEGEFDLLIKIPSQVEGINRDITIFFYKEEVSLAFGKTGAHCHSDYSACTTKECYYTIDIITLLEYIFQNKVCLFSDDENLKDQNFIDITIPEVIAENLDQKYGSGTIHIYSWDGSEDKVIKS